MFYFLALAFIFVANCVYGYRKNQGWYQKKLEKYEKLMEERNEQIPTLKRTLWSILMVFLPQLVMRYEIKTDFSQWEYWNLSPKYKPQPGKLKVYLHKFVVR